MGNEGSGGCSRAAQEEGMTIKTGVARGDEDGDGVPMAVGEG